MSLVRGVVSVVISRRLYPQLRLALRSWTPPHLRQLLSFSYYSMLLQVSTLLVLETDSVIIAAFLPIEMIAYFAIAASLVFYARSLIYGATYWITPRVSAMQATEDQRSGGRLALISGRWVTLLLHGITLTLLFRGETFIRLWMGPAYAELGGPVLLILCLALLFEGGRVVTRATMQGLNQHKALVPVFLIEAICTIALCLMLIQIWGIVGVALGTALPRIIASAIVVPRVFCRIQNIPLWDGMRELWIRPSVAMIPFAVATFLVEYFTHVDTLGVFFGTVLLVLPLGAIGGWRVGLDQSERDLLARSAVSLIRERKLSLMEVESDTV
jgi:O-antigen/teichoic acid export membrane protein